MENEKFTSGNEFKYAKINEDATKTSNSAVFEPTLTDEKQEKLEIHNGISTRNENN